MIRLFEKPVHRRRRLPRVRCVFCDLDGTLLSPGNEILDEVRDAVASLKQSGVSVVLASGRTHGFTLGYGKELELQTPVISLNGTLVKDAAGTLLHSSPLPPNIVEVLEETHRSILGGAVSFSLFTDEGIVSLDERPILPRYLRAGEDESLRVDSLQPFASRAVTLCAGGSYQAVQKLSVQLAKKFGKRLMRVLYQSGSGTDRYYLEVRLRNVSKATGVRVVLERLGIPRNASAAIGDYTNDLEMCKFVGVSAAMRNGSKELRAACDIITTRGNEEGGAADFFRMIGRRTYG
ncbi:Cof-type HAD-IIB family hydrolase [bacterium]|nr:Cof-type HAD-IIB family hydrolase [bacterium]